MPWEGVTVSEQKQQFIEDHQLNYYSVTELAERFSISRKTAHKSINRYRERGLAGLEEQSRRARDARGRRQVPSSARWWTCGRRIHAGGRRSFWR